MNQQSLFSDLGDALKQQGMEKAALNKEELIVHGTIRFIRALISSPSGIANIEDADLHSEKFADGGKWRGSIVRRLSQAGIIELAGATKSKRPSRHSGIISCWRIVDRDGAEKLLNQLISQAEQKNREYPT